MCVIRVAGEESLTAPSILLANAYQANIAVHDDTDLNQQFAATLFALKFRLLEVMKATKDPWLETPR